MFYSFQRSQYSQKEFFHPHIKNVHIFLLKILQLVVNMKEAIKITFNLINQKITTSKTFWCISNQVCLYA